MLLAGKDLCSTCTILIVAWNEFFFLVQTHHLFTSYYTHWALKGDHHSTYIIPTNKISTFFFGNFFKKIFRVLEQAHTTIPIWFFSPSFVSSMHSSTTKFMNGSKPRKTPVICLPPFSFTGKRETTISDKITEICDINFIHSCCINSRMHAFSQFKASIRFVLSHLFSFGWFNWISLQSNSWKEFMAFTYGIKELHFFAI